MKNLPTAEEYVKESSPRYEYGILADLKTFNLDKHVFNFMVRFAKIHVIAALEAAAEESKGYTKHCPSFAILESYPLENIK